MTIKDAQRSVLEAACARADRSLLPLPERLKGGAAKKTVAALVARGLAEETEAGPFATEAALQALSATETAPEAAPPPEAAQPAEKPSRRAPREGTKQAALIAMLRRESGATLDEMIAETGWAPHTVRGAMSGALKKRLGLDLRSEKVEGRGRVHFIAE